MILKDNFSVVKDYISKPLVILVSIFRVGSAVLILFNPFWGLLLSWFWDIFDSPIFLHIVGMPVSAYEYLDKNLDWFEYLSMLVVGARYEFSPLLTALFVFKLIGHILFLKNRDIKYFVYFPNFFEVGFVWLVVLKSINLNLNIYWLFVFLLLAMLREIYLHIIFPNYVEKHGFPKIYGIFGIRGMPKW